MFHDFPLPESLFLEGRDCLWGAPYWLATCKMKRAPFSMIPSPTCTDHGRPWPTLQWFQTLQLTDAGCRALKLRAQRTDFGELATPASWCSSSSRRHPRLHLWLGPTGFIATGNQNVIPTRGTQPRTNNQQPSEHLTPGLAVIGPAGLKSFLLPSCAECTLGGWTEGSPYLESASGTAIT